MHQSLAAMLLERVERSSDRVAVMYKVGKDPYSTMTWREFGALVDDTAFGLAAIGLEPDCAAAVMAETSNEWCIADLGILCNGAFSVPLYPTSSSADVHHILTNSESKFLFIENDRLLTKALKGKGPELAILQKIILLHPSKNSLEKVAADINVPVEKLMTLEQLRQLGAAFRQKQPNLIRERVNAITPGKLATVIYTSGTTGTPKGVMLLNSTIMAVVEDIVPAIPIYETDTYLAFLPLSHVFERVCGEFYWLKNGATRAYAQGIEHLPKNLQEVQPTVMLVVPRLLDKIYAKVMNGVSGASPRAQQLIHWAINVGRDVVRHRAYEKPLSPGLKFKHWIGEKLVYKKLRERIGKKLRFMVTGGAPGTPEVLEFFNAIGIPIEEGYGLTETAAPTNVNRVGRNKIGTVGPKLESVEVKLGDDGEILFKGPTIFPGYFKSPELSAEVFTDGWFHTGDIGEIDGDGFLKITDRKKDLIVNSAGKNIAPQKIEAILRTVPLVSQAVVFGDKRKTLVALITVDEQTALEFAHDKGWSVETMPQLSELKQFKEYLWSEIKTRSHTLADYEQIRNFAILPHEFSVDTGEMTATLKIKRSVIKNTYSDIVEALYKDEGALASAR